MIHSLSVKNYDFIVKIIMKNRRNYSNRCNFLNNKSNTIYCGLEAYKKYENNNNHDYYSLSRHKIQSRVFNSQQSAKIFNMDFKDYTIIGFDLDGTLLRYNLDEMVPLIYHSMATFLIDEKKYPKEILQPINNKLDFLQKGLFLDSIGGNTLKLKSNGEIARAVHGTRVLSDDEIKNIYGPEKKWQMLTKFIADPLSTWNGPESIKMRALLDYFDIPSSLIMARSVDAINATDSQPKKYNCYPDMLNALIQLYNREHFATCTSNYFEALKKNPEKYILKTDPKVIDWLRKLKETKAVYLLTGSNIDFANLTASYALGPDWRDLFDVVVTYARKPGFFTENRPFYKVENNKEIQNKEICDDLKLGNIYSQGNWRILEKVLKTKFKNITEPKSVYVGDNLLQDVYTPKKYCNIDTIAIVEELFDDAKFQRNDLQTYSTITKSNFWDSYFYIDQQETIWKKIVDNYAIACYPTVDYLC